MERSQRIGQLWCQIFGRIQRNNMQKQFVVVRKNMIHFFYIVSYIIYKSPLEACFSCFIKLKAPPGIFVEKKFLFLKVF